MNYTKKEYQEYLNQKSPNSTLLKDVLWAFFVGGIICVIGQAFFDIYTKGFSLQEEDARTAASITMIFLGALFTGLGIYDRIGKYAGGGSIVPITGFANSVVSPAMEFKTEGYIYGTAAKMFIVAGPIIVFGIASSVLVGILYFIGFRIF